ncbi:MAG: DedA family protein [Xanthomonadales bacterium]|nr:DedA family protein [Gammaproteobacteria bacterium]MBT8053563.1 DedA family protein [Gammaproteobacteria bacterium]NND57956.1 DedA family protein [Xanthomonadales bacterium]NNK50878.1 DedA family protein [Xanthomonadales bacterium]
METSWTQELLNWLNTHPGWGVAIVFLVAFFESLVLIGILLPGIIILFGVGTLIGLGLLEMIPIWMAASAGAFLGDTLSYLLGHRFRGHLLDIWPFSRYPTLMKRGTHFFNTHGAKSVVAGRFIGPLRPIIPSVAGMMGMKPARFLAVDIPACITWAPSFLLPGMLFGASLEVASEYTGRLTVMLVIIVAILWTTWWVMRSVYEPLATRSARWMRHGIRWSRRHPVLGRVAGRLLEPSKGDVLSVTMMGVLLVVIVWGLGMLLFLSPFADQPEALDRAVHDLALSLRNHLADPFMVAISQLSRWPVSIFAALALLLWLLGAGRKNAALHWLIAIGGGALLHLLLSWGLRTTPQVLEMADQTLQGPSAAMSLCTVVLSFFAVMEAGELPRRHRQWPYLVSALILILLMLARLYLGLEWLSGALMGVAVSLAWTAIVGIAYRQRAARRFSGATASLIFFGSFFALFAWQINANLSDDLATLEAPTVTRSIDRDAWWGSSWRDLPEERTQMASVASRQFNAQIAADPELVASLLARAGWNSTPEADWRWLIQALNPQPDQDSLPLLGRAFEGRSEELLLSKNLEPDGQLLTIRLWDSGVRLEPGGQVLYVAQLSEEKLVQRLGLFSYWRSTPLVQDRFGPIRDPLTQLEQKVVDEKLLLIRSSQAD